MKACFKNYIFNNQNQKLETMDNCTLVNKKTGSHYDTNDERFYNQNWEKTLDSEPYLKTLISNNPDKFEGYEIKNSENMKLQPHFNKIDDKFALSIQNGSQEETHFADNAEQIEKIALDKTGVEISYNYSTNFWSVPIDNQYDF